MRLQNVIIGTRGSALSLVQTNLVKDQLQSLFPNITFEVKTITTTGDKNMNPVPLDTVGKGWFTRELDTALLENRVDMTVHSLKDIPEKLPEGLLIAAVPKREDAREALVSRNAISLEMLKKGAVIGTDSTRRKAQILARRPDLVVRSLRGNVGTRLERLDVGSYDAIFLAVAGLKRLGKLARISEYFSETDVVPSPGQGALAVIVRKDDVKLLEMLKKLNDHAALSEITAERAFSEIVGGGCKMPVGAYARVSGKKLQLCGLIASGDGKHLEKDSISGASKDAKLLGQKLAELMLLKCRTWYVPVTPKCVILTRPEKDPELETKLRALGLAPFHLPTIRIRKNPFSKDLKMHLKNLDSYDWIVFTSQHGVSFFVHMLRELHIDPDILQKKKIAVVGPRTKDAAERNGLSVDFIPSVYTTADLGSQIKGVDGKKILLARSNIASDTLEKLLLEKGADVDTIAAYRTEFGACLNPEFWNLFAKGDIECLVFTSPSTVEGFFKNIPASDQKGILSLPVISIGPVTARAVKKRGFRTIYTANIHTVDGVVAKISEKILNLDNRGLQI